VKNVSIAPELAQNILRTFPQGVIAVDVETTGLSPLLDAIVEIGAVKITPSGVEIFETLVNPERPIPPSVIAIHHISDEMVKDAPTIREALPKFVNFVGSLPMLAHNAMFDSGFIAQAFMKTGTPLPGNSLYCSIRMAKVVHKTDGKINENGPQNFKLTTLCTYYKIVADRQHRAHDDALACLIIVGNLLSCGENSILSRSFAFRLHQFSSYRSLPLPDTIKKVLHQIETQEIIEIRYAGGSHKDFRPIRPIGLLPMPKGASLYALCLLEAQNKSFLLSKILETRILDKEKREEWAAYGERIRKGSL
jgi:DNA polymerase III epsilon subunit family exonuclease